MSANFTQDNFSHEQLHAMLSEGKQVWVRCPPNVIGGKDRHWARARLVNVIKKEALIKPIKHGGGMGGKNEAKLERVPLSVLRLWKSMNAKQ
jgi:hypothetical protein